MQRMSMFQTWKALGLLAALACVPAASAQTSLAAKQSVTSWENLRRLRPGQKIQVVQTDLKSWSGPFVSFSAESVALKAAEGDRTVPRAQVLRVSLHGGKRLRNALIGAAIGGGAGAGIGAAAGGCSTRPWAFCGSRGLTAAAVGLIGALAGGGAGAAIPGSTVLYRAPPSP